MNRDPDTAWHALSPEEATRRLELDAAHGLIADETSRRLDAHGPNRLAERHPRPAWLKFFDQFRSVLIIILLGAAVLAGAIGNLKDAVVIAVVVLLNASLGFIQEHRAEAALAALREMLAPSARVRRDGEVQQIEAAGLPGRPTAARGRRPHSGRRAGAVGPQRRGGRGRTHRRIPCRAQAAPRRGRAGGARRAPRHGVHEHRDDPRPHRGRRHRHRDAHRDGPAGRPAGRDRRRRNAPATPTRPPRQAAQRSAQYYINQRWLGGTLTNWQTVTKSIARLRETESIIAGGGVGLTKREVLNLQRVRDKLDRSLGGIASMGGVPDLMFVIDTNKEAIAIQEAKKLGIPVVAIVDSNCDPDGVTFPVPGNDDAARAIQLYCDLIADAVLDGLTEGQVRGGKDIGASERPPVEAVVRERPPSGPVESPIDGPTGANY